MGSHRTTERNRDQSLFPIAATRKKDYEDWTDIGAEEGESYFPKGANHREIFH